MYFSSKVQYRCNALTHTCKSGLLEGGRSITSYKIDPEIFKRIFESIGTARSSAYRGREGTYIIAKRWTSRHREPAKQRLVCDPLIRTGLLGSCKLYTQCFLFFLILFSFCCCFPFCFFVFFFFLFFIFLLFSLSLSFLETEFNCFHMISSNMKRAWNSKRVYTFNGDKAWSCLVFLVGADRHDAIYIFEERIYVLRSFII